MSNTESQNNQPNNQNHNPNEYDWIGKVEKLLQEQNSRPIPGVTPGTCSDNTPRSQAPERSSRTNICAI